MNIKKIEKNGSKATVVVEVEAELLESGKQKAYLKARKDIMIPGFRKGKAPRKMVERMYGADVFTEDAINEIFPEVYENTLMKSDELKPIGRPSVTDLQFPDEGGVEMTVETDLYPEVTLGEYKGVQAPKNEVAVTDAEIDAEIDRMAQSIARVTTVERPAEEGDTAVIDFEGFDNGVAFEGGKGENYELKLGSGSFVPGFEEQVVGMSAGEEKDIDVTFPEDYQKDLAGKPVVFHVKVHEVKQTVVPEKDDEFVKDVSEFDTMDELKADVKARLTKQKEETAQSAFERAAIARAAENMTAEIPDSMIDEEIDRQLDQFRYQLQMSGMSMEDYEKMVGGNLQMLRESRKSAATQSVRRAVLLQAIVEQEKIEATDEEVEQEYQRLAEAYQMEVDQVKKMVSAEALKGDVQTQKAAKLITESAVAVAPETEPEKPEE